MMPKSEMDKLYNKRTYERMYFEVRYDAEINGAVIREHAAAQGESMSGFIRRSIAETIQRDNEPLK